MVFFRTLTTKWATLIVMALVLLAFSALSPYFLTFSNFSNVLYGMVPGTLAALGLTYVICAGSFDLSIGLAVTFGSIVSALLIPHVGSVGAVLVTAILTALVGLINGLLVTYGRLSGIVVSLGMMFILGGLNDLLTRGYQVAVPSSAKLFLSIGQGTLGMISISIVLLVVLFLVGFVFMSSTRGGHYLKATGDNPMAGYYAGIRIYWWVTLSFILSAVFSGMGGVVLTSMSSSAQPVGGEGYLLQAFASVYLGATIGGSGRPHLLGTLIAAIFMALLTSGLNMVGAPYAMHELVAGAVLILAVGANAILNRQELHMRFI